MKIRNLVKTGPKGQIIIPKEMREALGLRENSHLSITIRNKGIYIEPVEEFIYPGTKDLSYTAVLEKTKGAFATEDWGSLRKKRKDTEIKASKKRRQAW